MYHQLAIEHMDRHKIPASITLAQGILESGAGQSDLATEANNHFGIKCHNWTGASIKQDDDEKDECFRKYQNVKEFLSDTANILGDIVTDQFYKKLWYQLGQLLFERYLPYAVMPEKQQIRQYLKLIRHEKKAKQPGADKKQPGEHPFSLHGQYGYEYRA